MARGDRDINIDKSFSKGFTDRHTNKTPDFYASNLYNIRIESKGIKVRLGSKDVYEDGDGSKVLNISSNDGLYVVQDNKFKEINLSNDPVDVTDKGTITTSSKYNSIVYGQYVILLSGQDKPRIYDTVADTLTQVTTTIDSNVNPSFGATLADFTVINDNNETNVVRFSRPIIPGSQERAYERNNSESGSIVLDGVVQGFASTLDVLWIVTSEKVYTVSRDSYQTVGGVTFFIAKDFASGDELASPNSIVNAGDFVFYLTKENTIKSIGYKQDIVEPRVTDISDLDIGGIDNFMQTRLDPDQSDAFAFFDKKRDLVKWYVKSVNSNENDVCLIYDIKNDAWLYDLNKFYNGVTVYDKEIYGGSSLSFAVTKDEFGSDDNGAKIPFRFESVPIDLDEPSIQKQRRGQTISGKINTNTVINREIFIDGTLQFQSTIDGAELVPASLGEGIGGSPIGGQPIGGFIGQYIDSLKDFSRVVDYGNLRATGKLFVFRLSGSGLSQEFLIDMSSIIVRRRERFRFSKTEKA